MVAAGSIEGKVKLVDEPLPHRVGLGTFLLPGRDQVAHRSVTRAALCVVRLGDVARGGVGTKEVEPGSTAERSYAIWGKSQGRGAP